MPKQKSNVKSERRELERRVLVGAREFANSTVLFRHAIGEMLGVNVTDRECLGILFYKATATPTELAKQTGLSSGATTAMLDRLENKGLIERRPNPADRRGTLIAIAPKAMARLSPLFTPIREAQEELASGYSKEELEMLSEFFKRLSAIWSEEREKMAKRKRRISG